MDVRLPLVKRNWSQQKFVYSFFRDWNILDSSTWDVTCLSLFREEGFSHSLRSNLPGKSQPFIYFSAVNLNFNVFEDKL